MALKVLFASNGTGEDQSAAIIARNFLDLLNEKDFVPSCKTEVRGASLLGGNNFYERAKVNLIFKGEMPPSGGFPLMNPKALLADLLNGGMFQLLRYRKSLREFSPDMLMVVGDPFFFFVNQKFMKMKDDISRENTVRIFLSLAKTEKGQKHLPWEINWMKKYAHFVFTRDIESAETLRRKGVKAYFLGNPMMDAIEPDPRKLEELSRKIELKLKGNRPDILLLPGSREEAYANFPLILESLTHLAKDLKKTGKSHKFKDITAVAALIPSWSEEKMMRRIEKEKWSLPEEDLLESKNGEVKILLTRGYFAESLKFTKVAIALAGTAMEQAAGEGVPVVSFPGKGAQTTKWRIFKNQKGILGNALFAVNDPEEAGRTLAQLLLDENLRERAASAGRKAMGGKGGAKRIALAFLKIAETLLKEGFPEKKIPPRIFESLVESTESILSEMERHLP